MSLLNEPYSQEMTQLERMIYNDEGFRKKPYWDGTGTSAITFGPNGFLTVGIGLNLDVPMTLHKAIVNMRFDLYNVIESIRNRKPIFRKMNENQQMAIVNMCYQMGVDGVLAFKQMWLAIESGDWSLAKKNALTSLWAKQTPARAKRVTDLFV